MSTEPPDPQSPAPEPDAGTEPAREPAPAPAPAAAPPAASSPQPPRPTTTLTWVLVGVALVVGGFLGGYFVGHQTGDHGRRSDFMHHRFGDAPGGLSPQIGSPGQGGLPMQGDFVVGTVTRVSGSTVYLRERGGNSVTVNTSGTTLVRVGNGGGVSSLQPGSAVVVRGTPGANGAIDASVIVQVGRYSSGTATT